MPPSAIIEAKRDSRRREDRARSPAERFRLGVVLRQRATSMYATAHGLTYGAALQRLSRRTRPAEVIYMSTAPQLLSLVHQRLTEEEIRYAIVGATAMGLHGYLRTTMDVDLLTDSTRVLEPEMWSGLSVEPDIIANAMDDDDPLFGKVTLSAENTDELVQIIVSRPGRGPKGVISGSLPMTLAEGLVMPVASPLHLVMMKLYAATAHAHKDLADIQELCAVVPGLIEQVDDSMDLMGETGRRLWLKIRSGD